MISLIDNEGLFPLTTLITFKKSPSIKILSPLKDKVSIVASLWAIASRIKRSQIPGIILHFLFSTLPLELRATAAMEPLLKALSTEVEQSKFTLMKFLGSLIQEATA